jgi:hypothetical protein
VGSTRIDHTGERFGRLVALQARRIGRFVWWECRCDCGKMTEVRGYSLRNGTTKSCGCYRRERSSSVTRARSRGLSTHPLRGVWRDLVQRCNNTTGRDFERYGKRGIRVCARWLNFEIFVQDIISEIGERPPEKSNGRSVFSIDRKNNDGNYEPGNVRWATSREQARNTRSNRFYELDGERLILMDWAARKNLAPSVVRARLQLGWSLRDALHTPVRIYKRTTSEGTQP